MIAPFGGFTGTVGYASNNAPPGSTITFTDSTANIFGIPNPPSGTAIFHARVIANSSAQLIAFDAGSQTASLTSNALKSSDTYWLCAFLSVSGGHTQIGVPINEGNPSGGTLTYPSPLTKQGLSATGGQLPTGVDIDLEFIQNFAGGSTCS